MMKLATAVLVWGCLVGHCLALGEKEERLLAFADAGCTEINDELRSCNRSFEDLSEIFNAFSIDSEMDEFDAYKKQSAELCSKIERVCLAAKECRTKVRTKLGELNYTIPELTLDTGVIKDVKATGQKGGKCRLSCDKGSLVMALSDVPDASRFRLGLPCDAEIKLFEMRHQLNNRHAALIKAMKKPNVMVSAKKGRNAKSTHTNYKSSYSNYHDKLLTRSLEVEVTLRNAEHREVAGTCEYYFTAKKDSRKYIHQSRVEEFHIKPNGTLELTKECKPLTSRSIKSSGYYSSSSRSYGAKLDGYIIIVRDRFGRVLGYDGSTSAQENLGKQWSATFPTEPDLERLDGQPTDYRNVHIF